MASELGLWLDISAILCSICSNRSKIDILNWVSREMQVRRVKVWFSCDDAPSAVRLTPEKKGYVKGLKLNTSSNLKKEKGKQPCESQMHGWKHIPRQKQLHSCCSGVCNSDPLFQHCCILLQCTLCHPTCCSHSVFCLLLFLFHLSFCLLGSWDQKKGQLYSNKTSTF